MNNATQKTNSLDGLIKWEINNVLRDVDRDGREFKFTTTTATKTNKIFCRHYKRMHTRSIIHITRTHTNIPRHSLHWHQERVCA